MSTFAFIKSGDAIQINSYEDANPSGYVLTEDTINNTLTVAHHLGRVRTVVDCAADTITINGEEFSGTATELKEALETDIFSGGGGVVSELVVYSLSTILTHAQILTLPTTPVTLVPSPGAGKAIVYHNGILSFNYVGNYSGIGADAFIYINPVGLSGGYAVSQKMQEQDKNEISNLLAAFESGIGMLPITSAYDGELWYATSILENKGVQLVAQNNSDANFTGGHADNTLKATVYYSIIDL